MVRGFSHFAPLLMAPFSMWESVTAAPSAKILGMVLPRRSIRRLEHLLFILETKKLVDELYWNGLRVSRHSFACIRCWSWNTEGVHVGSNALQSYTPSIHQPSILSILNSLVIVKHIILPFICSVTSFFHNNDNDPQMSKVGYSSLSQRG